MDPLLPNNPSNKCADSTGSNCISYNGQTIACISNCVGDSVSDVLYKLGQKECYIESLLDLSALDLSCCYTPCPNCQEPTTIVAVFQAQQDCICALQARVLALETTVARLNAGT